MLTTCIMICSTLTLGRLPCQGPSPTSFVTIRAVGIGYPPPRTEGVRGRLMARRAAEVAAARNLGAKLRLAPRAHLPSFRYVSTKHLQNGSIEVTVEATVTTGKAAIPDSLKKIGSPRRLFPTPGRTPPSQGSFP